jgi:hypothetical protein
MKQKASPAMIAVAAVAIIGFLLFMYRYFFPPMPPNDTDNPNGMPLYAQKFLENKKKGQNPGGAPASPGPSTQNPGQPQDAASGR